MKIDNNQISITLTNWWKTQTNKPTNCLSEFEHFVLLALKEISTSQEKLKKNMRNHYQGTILSVPTDCRQFYGKFPASCDSNFFPECIVTIAFVFKFDENSSKFWKIFKQTLKFSLTVTEQYLHHFLKLFQNR